MYQYCGTLLGSFDFTGTKEDFEGMLADLQKVAPEFEGKLETGSTRDHLPGQGPGNRNCLTYNGEAIAIEI